MSDRSQLVSPGSGKVIYFFTSSCFLDLAFGGKGKVFLDCVPFFVLGMVAAATVPMHWVVVCPGHQSIVAHYGKSC